MNINNSKKLSKTTVKATNIDSLPEELLFDILARLPAEFLHDVSRLVCSKWRSVIRSDAFANKQLSHHSAFGLLLSSQFKPRHDSRHSIYATATQGQIEAYSRVIDRTSIIGCCNSMALALRDNCGVNGEIETPGYSLYVINPLTKKSFRLPSFPVQIQSRKLYNNDGYGIGYSDASMKYKVTLPYYKHVEGDDLDLLCLAILILTVGVDQSWRLLELPDPLRHHRSLLVRSPVTSEGFLHWGSPDGCLTLNVETEIFTWSAIPNIIRKPRYRSPYKGRYKKYYLSTGRYLSLLVGRDRKFCWDVWEMQSGGEWRKLEYKIDLKGQRKRLQQFATRNRSNQYLFPFGWVKYPEILVLRFSLVLCCSEFVQSNCIFYNLKTHEINKIELKDEDSGGYKAFAHRKSLLHMV